MGFLRDPSYTLLYIVILFSYYNLIEPDKHQHLPLIPYLAAGDLHHGAKQIDVCYRFLLSQRRFDAGDAGEGRA
jgi:hypothetical protein